MPWYTITDRFDADFGVNELHGHNVFFRDREVERDLRKMKTAPAGANGENDERHHER
jgi:hypothetical protein